MKFLPEFNAVDLRYRFLRTHWGKGFATEAGAACIKYGFESLGLENIMAFVIPENVESIRVLEKLSFGFEKEFIEDGLLVYQYALSKKSCRSFMTKL